MTIKRAIATELIKFSQQYPVVTVLGPRQSGKTTLVREMFPDYHYLNLEEPDIRAWASTDPRALLNKYPERLILDEIQQVPELLSYLQVRVDEAKQEGMFILTGSHQIELHQAVSQSLAGRTALLQLLPLSLSELASEGIVQDIDDAILSGGYPRVHVKGLDPAQAYRDYMKTYVERDVRQMINIRDLTTFNRFMKLCAGRTSQVLNMNNLANEVGVSHHTIKHWLSILQAAYLIELLVPYFENINKQVIKSPKLYFTDTGLACHLLDIEMTKQLDRDPLRGALFENLVVMELLKSRYNQARSPQLYYYRDAQQNEVDVIFKQGSMLMPIEIKSAQTFNTSQLKGLKYFKKLLGDRSLDGVLLYGGTQEMTIDNYKVLNFRKADQITQTA